MDGENRNEEFVSIIRKAIKDAFDAATNEAGLTVNDLYNKLKKYRFSFAKGTLRNVLGISGDPNNSLDLECLVALCRFFGLDMNKLLSLGDIKDEDCSYHKYAPEEYRVPDNADERDGNGRLYADMPFVKSLSKVRKKFGVLDDEGYSGTFYCYTAYKDKSRITPIMYVLSMNRNPDTKMTSAVLYEAENDNGKIKAKENQSYHGVPVYVKAHSIIILFMSKDDNRGEFLQLAFSYENYTDGRGLIFRHGILLTAEKASKQTVVTQSFVLFNRMIEENDYIFVLGLLNPPNHNFSVPVKEVEKLAKENPIVAEFVKEYGEVLERNKKSVYMFSEDNILSDKESGMVDYDVIKALLLLKQQSRLSNNYHYRAEYRYTSFGVNYLADPKRAKGQENREE